MGLGVPLSRSILDDKKLEFLADLMPDDVSMHRSMKSEERQKYLEGFPRFNFIPQALQKDLSNLSSRLSRSEKEQINFLYRAQLRMRQKLRVILSHMYENLDVSKSMNNQNTIFQQWNSLLELTLDDFIWFVKRQQEIIFRQLGLQDVLDIDEGSIIPMELKARIKEVSEFQRHFGTGRFSGQGNSWRGRGSRYSGPSRYSSNNGQYNGRRRFSGPRSGNSHRSRSPHSKYSFRSNSPFGSNSDGTVSNFNKPSKKFSSSRGGRGQRGHNNQ